MTPSEIQQVQQAIGLLQAAIVGNPAPQPTPTPAPQPAPTPAPQPTPSVNDPFPPTQNTVYDFMMNPATAGGNNLIRCNTGESASFKFNTGPVGTLTQIVKEDCVAYNRAMTYCKVSKTPNTFVPYPDIDKPTNDYSGICGGIFGWAVISGPGSVGLIGLEPNTDYYFNIRNENAGMTEPGVYGGRGIETAQPGLGLTYGFLFQWH